MNSNSKRGQRLAEAATRFIGVRFQLLGRDPAQGLDCIGLLACSLQAIGCQPIVPKGYRLRNSDASPWIHCAGESGLLPLIGSIKAGDVLLFKAGPGQHHIVIAESETSAIHAHAGLRRVVRQPMTNPGEKLAHWRLT